MRVCARADALTFVLLVALEPFGRELYYVVDRWLSDAMFAFLS